MTRPPTAVLVLLSCVIPTSLWPRLTVVTGTWVEDSETPFADRMALFEQVLFNDVQWSPVLKQRVKLSVLSLPRYHMTEAYDDVLKRVQLVNQDDDQEPPVIHVLQKLMKKTPWSGTNVNYTAYVLSSAVTCFTYNNVSFVLSLVLDRIGFLTRKIKKSAKKTDKNKDDENENGKKSDNVDSDSEDKTDDKVNLALDDVRMTLAVFVDKLAAVEGELAFFSAGLYDYDGAEKSDDDLLLLRVLEMMKEEVDTKLQRYCHLTPHDEIYRYLGKYESLNASPPPPDTLAPDDETLTHELSEFDKIIDSMIEVYDGLNVETMPMESWLEILDYKLPFSMEIKFYVDGKLKLKPEDAWSERLKRAFDKEHEKEKSKKKKKGKSKNKDNTQRNKRKKKKSKK